MQQGRPAVMAGYSDFRPYLGSRSCSIGKHEWVVRLEGDNYVMVGVAEEDCDLKTGMHNQVSALVWRCGIALSLTCTACVCMLQCMLLLCIGAAQGLVLVRMLWQQVPQLQLDP